MSTTFPSRTSAYGVRYCKFYRSGYRLTVDATVTSRMVRALRRIGYSNARISREAGVGNTQYVSTLARFGKPKVRIATAEAIADYYWRHHLKPLDDPDAKKVITHAKKAGMAPPAAFDDITDLSEQPKGIRK